MVTGSHKWDCCQLIIVRLTAHVVLKRHNITKIYIICLYNSGYLTEEALKLL